MIGVPHYKNPSELKADIRALLDALAAAEQERDEAREALRRIAHFPFNVMRDATDDLADVREIALAAIAEGER